MITINTKTSKTYNFYKKLSKVFVFKQLTPKGNVNLVFTDLCTFLRTTLYYIFIGIPYYFLSVFLIFVSIYYNILYISSGYLNSFVLLLLSVLAIVCVMAIIYYTCVFFSKKSKKLKEDSWLYLTSTAIKSKHDKICKRIKLENNET